MTSTGGGLTPGWVVGSSNGCIAVPALGGNALLPVILPAGMEDRCRMENGDVVIMPG